MSGTYSLNYQNYMDHFPKSEGCDAYRALYIIKEYADQRHAKIAPVSANAPIAHIILGYPGNGKTTFVRKSSKPKDQIFSVDELRNLIRRDKNVSEVSNSLYLEYFDNLLDIFTSSQKNIWFDGIFLSLPLRMVLITTLHELGYQVYVYSLLNDTFMNLCFKSRIHEQHFKTGCSENIVCTEMVNTLRRINEECLVDFQESQGLFQLHADKYITY